ncbi:hypothetical protein BGX26_003103, partial [Mortierella sp. AD094]
MSVKASSMRDEKIEIDSDGHSHLNENQMEEVEADDDAFSQRSYHGRFGFYHRHSYLFGHLIFLAICIGLFVPAVIVHKEGNILVISLLFACAVWWTAVRLLPDGTLSKPISIVWGAGAGFVNSLPPIVVKVIGYGIPPVALILTAALRADDMHGTRGQRLISCLGLVVLLFITWIFSKNRRVIAWKIVWT